MLKYINMPKLVAFYLKEFSYRRDGTTSDLYWYVYCLCLPFIFPGFRRARMIALAIAECTNSRDQILRILNILTDAEFWIPTPGEYRTQYSGSAADVPDFGYDGTNEQPLVFYNEGTNESVLHIRLNGASRQEIEAYLELLIPFYINLIIVWH